MKNVYRQIARAHRVSLLSGGYQHASKAYTRVYETMFFVPRFTESVSSFSVFNTHTIVDRMRVVLKEVK